MGEKTRYKTFRYLRNFGGNGESIFLDDFVNFLKIPCKDVRNDILYRDMGIDFIINNNYRIDIKTTNLVNKIALLEKKENIKTGEVSHGWFYTSNADAFFFIEIKTRKIYIINRTEDFYNYYNNKIKPSVKIKESLNGNMVNYYRIVNISMIQGFYSLYQRFI